MTEQELYLFQLTPGSLAQFRACAAKVMRRQLCHANSFRILLYHMPDRLLCDAIAPNAAHFSYSAENPAPVDPSSMEPLVQFRNHPVGNGDRSNVSSLTQQIDNGPVILALLEMVESQTDCLMPPQSACQEQGQKGPIPFSFDTRAVWCLPECRALFSRQPISKPHAQLLDAFDSANAGCEVRAKKAAVGCLIRKAAHRPQSQFYSA